MTTPDAADRARELAAAMYSADAASRAAGMEVTDVAPGRATAGMTVRPDMINGHSTAHGGYVFLLADTAFAFAANTYGEVTVAQACDISFLEPCHLDDRLVAIAVERHRAGRTGIYDVTVRRGEDGPVVAEFRGRGRTTGRSSTG
jgi:acyl-CoA thioesterase